MANLMVFLCVMVALIHTGNCDKCTLPPDSGSCLDSSREKVETRYYYSAKNLKCASMPYVGCGGNSNNFKTMEECKKTCGGKALKTSLIESITTAQKNSSCWFNNRVYRAGEEIPEITSENPCRAACFCRGGFNEKMLPEIVCADVDCFAHLEPGCVSLDNPHKCCSESYCPEKNKPEPFKCSYNGKEYFEGQTIYPDDYSCITCSCNKNWKGILTTEGGICTEVNCMLSVDYHSRTECEPQYYTTKEGRELCCPIEWNCKSG